MNVIYNSTKAKKFCDIKVGECFYYSAKNRDILLMKTEELQGITGIVFNAVSLENGVYYDINKYLEVEYDVVKTSVRIEC